MINVFCIVSNREKHRYATIAKTIPIDSGLVNNFDNIFYFIKLKVYM